jgi:hypothetical protein
MSVYRHPIQDASISSHKEENAAPEVSGKANGTEACIMRIAKSNL